MPAYEGEDHWIYFCELPEGSVAAPWWYRERAEKRIRNLGRNLAIAGALAAAYEQGWAACDKVVNAWWYESEDTRCD